MAGALEAVTIASGADTATAISSGNGSGSTIHPGSDWTAVAAAVRQRMTALRITTVELARNTGVSEATIRSIRAETASPRAGTLVRLSKGLGWPGDYLEDVAAGKAYLSPHSLTIRDVITRMDTRLERVESQLDKLIRALDDRPVRHDYRPRSVR